MTDYPDWLVEELNALRGDMLRGLCTREEYAAERARILADYERGSDEQDMRDAGRTR